jgi:deoxycytidine triphosphate deaminase
MLSDQDIAAVLFSKSADARLVDPLPEDSDTKWDALPPDDPKWATPKSPIQPSSLDLHVGYIYVPGKKPGELGSEARPATSHSVGPGESIIVSTYESLNLPRYLGGIVFPPSKLSSQGVLVANIGHIDPGFSGHLRFTLINMGGRSIPLVRGIHAVGTLLMMRLTSPSETPWLQRQDGAGIKGQPTRDELEALSRDFGNIDVRIATVTEQTVDRMKNSYNLWAFLWPIILSLAIGVATIFVGTGQFLGSRLDANLAATAEVRNQLAEAKADTVRQQAAASIEFAKLHSELDEARRRLAQLETQTKPLRSSQQP